MALEITVLTGATLTATVEGNAILASIIASSATLNVNMGVPGPAATVQVGTTTTGIPGTDASVTNSGTTSAAILNFTIPRGDVGATGAKGDKGDTGNAGSSATIQVGSTTTLSAGSPATVSNSGSTSAAVFNFGIPQGLKGDNGSNGVGVATGGTTGQALVKLSGTNYDTGWATISGGGGTWGSITGTLSNQTDLALALSEKLSTAGGTMTGVLNTENTDITITNGNFNLTNAADPDWTFTIGDSGQYLDTATTAEFVFNPAEIKVGYQNTGLYTRLNGTGITFTDSTQQTTAALPLTGGSMTGDIAFLVDGNGDDTALGSFGLGTENTDGKVAYIEPTQIRIYDNAHLTGTALNGTGITFNDETVQVTAGLPLTGGTLTGSLALSPDIWNSGVEKTISGSSVLGDTSSGYILQSGGDEGRAKLIINLANSNDGYNVQAILRQSELTFKDVVTDTTFAVYGELGIIFPDSSVQVTAFIPADYLSTSAAYSTFLTQSSAASTYFPKPTGTTSQFIDGTGGLQTYGPLGDRYLTSSTSTLTCDSGNGKTMTVGTGLSYSRQQDITVSYDTANHMHGTVLTYNSTTGVMTFDSNTHSGGGTYSNWEVNVGGVAGAILPVGGTAGQVLAKINSTNFNTEWKTLGTMSTEPASAYLSTASAVANYLTISSASSTYQTQSGMSAYLSTSAAASTYQTQSGMSAYLSTASAVANYQTISGMSAYLSTASASANFIGTSAYATTAQAQAGTSTTTVVNPATMLDAKYFQGGKSMVQIAWSTSVSGTGASASAQNSNARLNAGPTSATGYAIASAVIANNSRGTIFNSGFDFSKRVSFGLRVARNVVSPDTNSVFRYSIGKSSGTDASDLSARGLMIKVAGSGALQLLVHNGTTLTTTTSSFTPTNGQAYDVIVTSDGAGNCALFVNGSSVATSTGGPTTAGATNAGYLMFELQNTSVLTGSPQNIAVSDYYVQVNS
jgi:hypothetical protein